MDPLLNQQQHKKQIGGATKKENMLPKSFLIHPNEWIIARVILGLALGARLLIAVGWDSSLVPFGDSQAMHSASIETMLSGVRDYEELDRRIDHYCKIDRVILCGDLQRGRNIEDYVSCVREYTLPLASVLGLSAQSENQHCSYPSSLFVERNFSPARCKIIDHNKSAGIDLADMILETNNSRIARQLQHIQGQPVPSKQNIPVNHTRDAEQDLEGLKCMLARLFFRMHDVQLQKAFNDLSITSRSALLMYEEEDAMIHWYLSEATAVIIRHITRTTDRLRNTEEVSALMRNASGYLQTSDVCGEGGLGSIDFCNNFLPRVMDVADSLDKEQIFINLRGYFRDPTYESLQWRPYWIRSRSLTDICLSPHLKDDTLITGTCKRAMLGREDVEEYLDMRGEPFFIYLTRLLPIGLNTIWFISLYILSSSFMRKRYEAAAARRRRHLQEELKDPHLRNIIEKRAARSMPEAEVKELLSTLSEFASDNAGSSAENSKSTRATPKWNSQNAAKRVILRKLRNLRFILLTHIVTSIVVFGTLWLTVGALPDMFLDSVVPALLSLSLSYSSHFQSSKVGSPPVIDQATA